MALQPCVDCLIYTELVKFAYVPNPISQKNKYPIVAEIISMLSNTSNNFTFISISSYKGISQNKIVNRATKEATTYFPLPYISISS